MTPQETKGNVQDTLSNVTMTDAAVLRYTADQVEALIETCEGLGKRIDHVDEVAHQVDQKVTAITETLEKYRPLLERFADPGAAVRGFLGGKRKQTGNP